MRINGINFLGNNKLTRLRLNFADVNCNEKWNEFPNHPPPCGICLSQTLSLCLSLSLSLSLSFSLSFSLSPSCFCIKSFLHGLPVCNFGQMRNKCPQEREFASLLLGRSAEMANNNEGRQRGCTTNVTTRACSLNWYLGQV